MIGFRLGRTVLLGIRSLALHKLRSVLTVLGIIFGVSSVIAMLSIGEGANYEAQEEIKKLGSNNIILKSVKVAQDKGSGITRAELIEYGLTWEDYERIRATVPTARDVVPMRVIPSDARYKRETMDVDVVGTAPSYREAGNLRVARGRFLTSQDVETFNTVAVLGAHVARTLYVVDDPLGAEIKLGQNYFKVVGILEATGSASGTGPARADDRNKAVYVPVSTARERYGENIVRVTSGSRSMERVELHQIVVSLHSESQVEPTATVLRGLVPKFHKQRDVEVLVPLELLKQKERTKRIFNIVLGSIAAISLLVGGIGIMNIMLASIVERTREIGIRRALGAKRRDIITQFLVETVVLSTTGGLLGILLGVAIPYVVQAASGMRTIITPFSLVLSFGISAAVGVVFGLYPATRAAEMDPIEALRRE